MDGGVLGHLPDIQPRVARGDVQLQMRLASQFSAFAEKSSQPPIQLVRIPLAMASWQATTLSELSSCLRA